MKKIIAIVFILLFAGLFQIAADDMANYLLYQISAEFKGRHLLSNDYFNAISGLQFDVWSF